MNEKRQNKKKMYRGLSIICLVFSLAMIIVGCGSETASSPTIPTSTPLPTAPEIPTGKGVPTALNMGMNTPGGKSLTELQAPKTAKHIKKFTLTAQKAQLKLSSGIIVTDAWTFNGVAPGPTLHVQQGDLLEITLINHLPFDTSIHWHGININNASDGVAGVTQDGVKPGQTYVYRFLVNDAGSYWYHSHAFSYEETTRGLYGMLVVDPARPTIHDDIDYSIALHDWSANNQSLTTLNATIGTINQTAKPGQWVRLRISNTANLPHLLTLTGAPFTVAALDGHELNQPQSLTEKPLLIGAAQRYDLRFQMPAHGSVALVTSRDQVHYQQTPAVVIGTGTAPAKLTDASKPFFDFSNYGHATTTSVTASSHFDQNYTLDLGNHMGQVMGHEGMTYTFNKKSFPNTDMLMVKEGQVIKVHVENTAGEYHPIHLHGHAFTVLTHNGKALTGTPVMLDTINVAPHDSYDIGFLANNPGVWMIHCHNLLHAYWGMDTMLVYTNINTPYTIGSTSGNFPD
ncbi:hypothetical protein KDA_53990 [Dictyobacter alpinus]|uniref:Copper-containing nitrite reductase n=1 Tax=Dictyobacter alpinus TaxID=2014873 RepID=A0A402BEX6_9CHLR|nr:multicopper oxidase family protein [Dictyobacter alpinus]GCE29915.1 hypothetical protein KDA_53990 [Dictyobacter alpinus]